MKHINDSELMEYAAGKISSPRKEQVAEHLAACPECSERQLQAAKTWDTLGHWTVETTGHDIASSIVAMAEKAERKPTDDSHLVHRHPSFVHRFAASAVVRVAASIIIAIGVGYRLGRYTVTGKPETAAVSKSRPAYLSALGLEWSSELTWLVLEDDSASSPQGQEGQR